MDDKIVRFPSRFIGDPDEPENAIKYYGAIASDDGGVTLFMELHNGERKYLDLDSASELAALISIMNASEFLYYNEERDTVHAYNRRDRFKWPD